MIHNKRPVTHNTNVKIVESPGGFEGEGFMAMQLSKVVGLARKNSIWPLPFATSLLRNRVYGDYGFDIRFGTFWI